MAGVMGIRKFAREQQPGKITERVYPPSPALVQLNDLSMSGFDPVIDLPRVIEMAREVEQPRVAPVAAAPFASPVAAVARQPREVVVPVRAEKSLEDIAREKWEDYNRSGLAADFVRADEALMRARQPAKDGGETAQGRKRETVKSIGKEPEQADGEGWQKALAYLRQYPMRPGEAQMQAYNPSLRDIVGSAIAGDDPRSYAGAIRGRLADALVGSTGLEGSGTIGFGALDVAPRVGAALQAGDVGKAMQDEDYLTAGAMAALPAAFAARRQIADAGRRALEVARQYAPQAGATAAVGATMMPQEAEAGGGNIVRNVIGAGRYLRPRSPEQAADDVAMLLRKAREKEVTDSLLEQADPRLLHDLYVAGRTGADMPMDYESRMRRATDLGFDKTLYRGTQSREALNRTLQTERLEGKTAGTGSWFSDNPDIAATYSGLREFGPVTLPIMARSQELRRVPWEGRLWSEGPQGMTTDQIARLARSEGAKGVSFSDVTDVGPYLWNRLNTQTRLPETAESTVIFDPSVARSPFARFDPRLEHLSDLSRAEGGEVEGYDKGGAVKKALDLIGSVLPPVENSRLTQIATTGPSYTKALERLNAQGFGGNIIDYGAGRGHGATSMGAHSFEPYPSGWTPTFTRSEDIPDAAYGRLLNLNVLNVLPQGIRDNAVRDMGRIVEPGGGGIISTRGRDVLSAKGEPGPEIMSMIIGQGDTARYQKGFTPKELREYIGDTLGSNYDVMPSDIGAASIMFKRNRAEGGAVENEPGIVDRALSFLSQFNPIGSAEAAPVGKGVRTLVAPLVTKPKADINAMPQLAERYPIVAPPVRAIDAQSGKEFMQKSLSEEAQEAQMMRKLIQGDIEAGRYEPYFPVERRFDVDPSFYPEHQSTLSIIKKKPETQRKYELHARSPEATQRLDTAFERGMRQADLAGNWYFMGQLEKEYINEYGPTVGRALFKTRFPDAMAATTGGADPSSNLLMAHLGNFLQREGRPMPTAAHEFPFPVGGRYVTGNMDQYRKMIMENAGVTPANPKRYNFSENFLGRKGPTIDEQMSGLYDPGMAMPPAGTYGHYQGAMEDLARRQGVDPRFYQEVAWAGAKDAKTKGGYRATPMIETVNQAIERTSRLTGTRPEDVVRRALIRAEMPLYASGGAVADNAIDAAKRIAKKSVKIKEPA